MIAEVCLRDHVATSAWASGEPIHGSSPCSTSTAAQPGRLAQLTGLTTGSVTGVIDRLERAGFVEPGTG